MEVPDRAHMSRRAVHWRSVVLTLTLGLGALDGCGSRLEDASISIFGSDLAAGEPPAYNVVFSVFGDSACQAQSPDPSFTMSLDGMPVAYQDCIASASGLFEDRSFTIGIHDGGDAAEIVVADLFPGLLATANTPVAAGSTFDVTVPTELQFETPLRFGAQFTYLDADDPTYLGDATNPTSDPGVVHVIAPQHLGHFTLWIVMSPPFPYNYLTGSPKATIVSCTGLSSCRAEGAPDIGPLAIEVVATP